MKRNLAPENLENVLKESRLSAEKRSLFILERCFSSHNSKGLEFEDILYELATSLGLIAGADLFQSFERVKLSPKAPLKTNIHSGSCQICQQSGNLIYCSTCSLSFHGGCIKPRFLEDISDAWSCFYCIADGTVPGDVDIASNIIKMTQRNQRGLLIESYFDDLLTKIDNPEISLVRSNRKILVRKNVKNQFSEIGRFNSLEEAIENVCDLKPIGPSLNTQDSSPSNICSYCFDDPNQSICAFCGCNICFGKIYPECFIRCEDCDLNVHSYCLKPNSKYSLQDGWLCSECEAHDSENEMISSQTNPTSVVDSNKKASINEISPQPNESDHFGDSSQACSTHDNCSKYSKQESPLDEIDFLMKDIPSLNSVRALISRLNENSILTPENVELFEQFRSSAPIHDLRIALKELSDKRKALCKRFKLRHANSEDPPTLNNDLSLSGENKQTDPLTTDRLSAAFKREHFEIV